MRTRSTASSGHASAAAPPRIGVQGQLAALDSMGAEGGADELGGELAGFGGGHAPSHHVAGVDVDDDEQLVVDAAFGPLSPIPPASGSDRSRG